MKRTDTQIYIIAHRPVEYGIWDNSLYTPVQVGYNERFLDRRDSDFTENIADLNVFYAEGTATYYIWKTHSKDAKYVGQCQYRRRLEFDEDLDFCQLFKDYDVIVASPLMFLNTPLYRQYASCHSEKDIRLVEDIIKEKFPEYGDSFDNYIKFGSFLFYSNGFVMRAEDFDRYAEWLFAILDEFRNRKGWDTEEQILSDISTEIKGKKRPATRGARYQAQLGGFLSERLLTLYILHNFDKKRIMCRDYKKLEEGI